MLRRQVLAKNANIPENFPIKFSKISTDPGKAQTKLQVGLRTANEDSVEALKFPKKRTISKIVVHKVDDGGHWHLECTADKVGTKPDSPDQKIIKIDLVQDSYRIIYNAKPESTPLQQEVELMGKRPTAEDIYRIVVDVAKQKGKWTEGYNCQSFVDLVLERIGTLPSSVHKS